MTIGEKIKYCRKNRLGLSQAKFAELCGISLVSIKRYETNKMIPTAEQIAKIAKVVGISTEAYSEPVLSWNFKLNTYGDLIKLMMICRKNSILSIVKSCRNGKEPISFTINSNIGNAIQAKMTNSFGEQLDCDVTNISFIVKNQAVAEIFLKWDNIYSELEFLYENHHIFRESIDSIIKKRQDELDLIELEMQFNSLLLERL
ncbi:MAG: helix-turn-helix transcriptional regulator [Oscillospiraceae bacterium]|nr:helix-turn-helix transcriptional regulator [Oscillospiraceae bacterium]